MILKFGHKTSIWLTIFLSAIWLSHDQCLAISKEQFHSPSVNPAFYSTFIPKVMKSLIIRFGSKPGWVPSGNWNRNLHHSFLAKVDFLMISRKVFVLNWYLLAQYFATWYIIYKLVVTAMWNPCAVMWITWQNYHFTIYSKLQNYWLYKNSLWWLNGKHWIKYYFVTLLIQKLLNFKIKPQLISLTSFLKVWDSNRYIQLPWLSFDGSTINMLF